MNIDPFWTPAGRAAAIRHGITLAEAVAVIDAPTTVFAITPDRAIFCIGAAGARVITVVCDRRARNTTIYDVTDVRPASPAEANAWRSKQR